MPAAKFEIKRKCSICGEEFLAKTIESRYCSPRCSKVAWKRRKDEEKRNLRLDEVVKSIHKETTNIDKIVKEFQIEKEKIISPDPMIAVPVVEAMRYTSHKEELREMFTNLLGAAMNADSIDAHPAFVDIIKQLSPDEGKMIKYLYQDDKQPMIKIRVKLDNGAGESDILPYFSDICYKADCQYPQKFPEYLDNLHRLGIVEVYYERFLVDEKYYEELKHQPYFPHIEENEKINIVEKKSMYELSEFGKEFCKVCLY